MIYFVTYSIAAACSEVGFRLRQKKIAVILIVLSLLIPALLAGLRDVTIGVDRLVYADSLFYDVVKSSDFSHMESRWEGWIETGYIWLNFFVSRLSSRIEFFYFVHAFIINTCVLISLKNMRMGKYVGLTYGIYLFLFFQPSFNSVRQSLAASLILLSLSFFLSKKNLLSLFFFLLAFFMHHSAILAVSFLGIYFFSRRKESLKEYIFIDLGVFFFLIFGGVIINVFAPYLNVEIGRYDSYFAKSADSISTFNMSLFCLNMLLYVPVYKNWKTLVEYDKKNSILIVCVLGLVLFSQIGLFGGQFIGRVVTYFYWTLLLLIPQILNYGKKKNLSMFVFCSYSVLYWWYYFIFLGFNQTYPYKSQLLGM